MGAGPIKLEHDKLMGSGHPQVMNPKPRKWAAKPLQAERLLNRNSPQWRHELVGIRRRGDQARITT